MITSPAFSGKTYMVLGLASSGMAAAETLIASGARVFAWDRRANAREALEGRAELADPLTIDLTGFDAIVVSPGVPLNTHPVEVAALRAGVPIIGDVELFQQARQDLPAHNVVGISGTAGKSSTTALLHHILNEAGVRSLTAGNMGAPILAQEPLPEGGVYILELSSYQLDLTRTLACDAAALTNIRPDHLERHGNFENYAASKARLLSMQGAGQFAVLGGSDDASLAIYNAERSRRAEGRVVLATDPDIAAHQKQWAGLPGPHSLANASVAVALAEELGVSRQTCLLALASYRGLEHRMEVIGSYRGVLVVNDSRGNSPVAAAHALASWPPSPDRRIHWICGGAEKGEGLEPCEPWFGHIATAYTIGECGKHFAEVLAPHTHVERCEMLCEAIRQAFTATRPGDVILLSPACSSFDQFRDFAARGNAFREMVVTMAAESRAA